MNLHNYTTEDLICSQSFQHYCLGLEEADIQYWEKWVAANPSKRGEIEEAIRIISILTARQGNLIAIRTHLQDGIRSSEMLKAAIITDEEVLVPAINKKKVLLRFAGIAALFLIVVGTAWFFYSNDKSTATKNVTVKTSLIVSGNQPRKTIVLPDGSVVALRSNSSLLLAGDFNENNRHLTLSGEAFFDVAPKSLPFIVHTTDMDIEVLGTVFNISAYPDSYTETSLFRGKVSVSANEDPTKKIVLMPNQKFVVNSKLMRNKKGNDSLFIVRPLTVDPANFKAKEIAWVRSRLKIENESLMLISERLEKWYGIPIVFDNEEVKNYRYSGTFENETVIKALEALQLSYPFNFRTENNRIIISK